MQYSEVDLRYREYRRISNRLEKIYDYNKSEKEQSDEVKKLLWQLSGVRAYLRPYWVIDPTVKKVYQIYGVQNKLELFNIDTFNSSALKDINKDVESKSLLNGDILSYLNEECYDGVSLPPPKFRIYTTENETQYVNQYMEYVEFINDIPITVTGRAVVSSGLHPCKIGGNEWDLDIPNSTKDMLYSIIEWLD